MCKIPEYWLVDPKTREIEVYVLRGDAYSRVEPRNGVIDAPRLQLQLSTIEGPKLRVVWADGSAEIDVPTPER